MKNKYAFYLGTNPALSVAEIISVMERGEVRYEIIGASKDILIITADTEIDREFIRELGGTIKIIEILDEICEKDEPSDYRQLLSDRIIADKFYLSSLNKLRFGLSLYVAGRAKKKFIRVQRSLNGISINLKKELKKSGLQVGYVGGKEAILSSVSVDKNGLLKDNGLEIDIILAEKAIYLGKTISVQEFEDYGFRDFGRPSRDILSGTTPPKLAKIMINLAQAKQDATLYDPFCGSGTYLQEMVLLGYSKIYGSDISAKAVNDTTENLNWLKEKYQRKSADVKVFEADARKIGGKLEDTIDAIVTETYLGPPLKALPTKKEAAGIISELTDLYIESFKEFKKILKPHACIVIAFPAFQTAQDLELVPVLEQIENLDYKVKKILPDGLMDKIPEENLTTRGTFLYSRKDQKVKREIVVFEKI